MEKRKVQITGGSTYMVTLPKRWAESVGLEAGATVNMMNISPNAMIIKPQGGPDEDYKTGHLEVDKEEGAPLVRSLISLYIAGYEVIKITGKQFTSSQRSTIRQTTQSLIGPEIVEESSDQIVIRNLSDLSELSIKETLSRIHQISRSMFEDAIRSLTKHDKELALDVGDRDDDVDRLFLAISRRFRVMLYDLIQQDDEDVSRVEYFDYHTSAKQLERIADHSAKVAEIVPSLERKIDEELASKIKKAAERSVHIMDKALSSLEEADIDLANEALAKSAEVEDTLLELNEMLRNLDSQSSQLLGIVADSIDRVKEYGINIAETALNSSCPLPGENGEL